MKNAAKTLNIPPLSLVIPPPLPILPYSSTHNAHTSCRVTWAARWQPTTGTSLASPPPALGVGVLATLACTLTSERSSTGYVP